MLINSRVTVCLARVKKSHKCKFVVTTHSLALETFLKHFLHRIQKFIYSTQSKLHFGTQETSKQQNNVNTT